MYSTVVSKCDPLTSNTVAVTKQKLIIINTFDRLLFFFLRCCTVDDWFARDHKVSRVEWFRRAFEPPKMFAALSSAEYSRRRAGEKISPHRERRQEALSDDFLPFAGDPLGAVRFLRAKFVIVFALCFLSLRYVRKTKSELISCRIEPLTSSLWFQEM